MTIYIVLLLTIILLSLVNKGKGLGENKIYNFIYFIVLLFMICIPGLRHPSVGLDTFQYKYIFETLASDFTSVIYESRMEQGYLLLCSLVYKISKSFVLLQIISSGAFVIPVFLLSNKYSKSVWLSMALFIVYTFYYMCFNEMRQAIAMGLSCFAFTYLVAGNWKKYLLTVFGAFLFHHTAIIILPLVLILSFDKFKLWHIAVFVIGYFMLTLYLSVVYSLISSMQVLSYENDNSAGGYGLLAMQVITLIIAFFKRKKIFDEKENLYAFYFVAAAVMIFPICHTTPVMFRLERYLWLPMVLLVPNIIYSFDDVIVRKLGIFTYLILGYFFLFENIFSVKNQILPYNFYWQ